MKLAWSAKAVNENKQFPFIYDHRPKHQVSVSRTAQEETLAFTIPPCQWVQTPHGATMHDVLDSMYCFNTLKDEKYLRRIVAPLELISSRFVSFVARITLWAVSVPNAAGTFEEVK